MTIYASLIYSKFVNCDCAINLECWSLEYGCPKVSKSEHGENNVCSLFTTENSIH